MAMVALCLGRCGASSAVVYDCWLDPMMVARAHSVLPRLDCNTTPGQTFQFRALGVKMAPGKQHGTDSAGMNTREESTTRFEAEGDNC